MSKYFPSIFRLIQRRNMTTIPAQAQMVEEKYSKPLAWLHWIGAAGITFCTVSAVIAGQIPNDPAKTTKEKLEFRRWIMHYHESVGVLMLAAMFPRVTVRLLTKVPAELPANSVERLLSKASHVFLYGALIFMPVSGLAFGYFSCWGVPFFNVSHFNIFLKYIYFPMIPFLNLSVVECPRSSKGKRK
jgi:cytochrome b561